MRLYVLLSLLLLTGCGADASQSDASVQVAGQSTGDVFAFINERGIRVELPLAYTLRAQEADSRQVETLHLDPVRLIGTPGEEDPVFWYAIRLDVDEEGTVYVLDQGRRNVLVFDGEDTRGRELLRGRGEGPGELADPFLLSVSPKGDVFVADPGTRGFVFSRKGELTRTIPRSEKLTVSALLQGDGRIVTVHDQFHASGPMYTEHAATGQETRTFGPLIAADSAAVGHFSPALAFDGYLRPLPDGSFVHVLRRAGQILRYDRSGELMYAVAGMDEFDHRLPTMRREWSGSSTVHFGFAEEDRHRFVHRDADVAGDFLFVLSSHSVANAEGRLLDVYATADGSYCMSFIVPQLEGMSSFRIRGNRLYTLHGSGEAVYEWRTERRLDEITSCSA